MIFHNSHQESHCAFDSLLCVSHAFMAMNGWLQPQIPVMKSVYHWSKVPLPPTRPSTKQGDLWKGHNGKALGTFGVFEAQQSANRSRGGC